MSTLNINSFAQVPVRGQLDLQIAHDGVISGAVSAANGATPILAGDFVDLDPAQTALGQPQFISALYTDVNFGNMIFDPKSADVLTPNTIQVASRQVGPVMWLVAGGTINPGQFVEQANSSTLDVVVYGTSSSKLRGQALDPGTSGNLMRVILVGGTGFGS
jgi:hypothetical protein